MAVEEDRQEVSDNGENAVEYEKGHKPELESVIEDARTKIKFGSYDEKRFSAEEKAKIIEILSDPKWPTELREFAVINFIPINIKEDTWSDLRKRLEFINEHIPLELLPLDRYGLSTYYLLNRQLSYLHAINDLLGVEGWREILGSGEQCKQFSYACSSGSPIHRLSRETFAEYADRGSLPIEAEPGVEDRLDELRDVLNHSGIIDIATPLASRIEFTQPGEGRASGSCDNWNGDIKVSTSEKAKKLLIPTLLHELGHALEHRLSWDNEAREIFDRYIVLSQTESIANSPYAESFKLSDGAYQGTFIAESFAEDFRLYWLKPEDLSSGRLAIIDEFCDKFLSHVDRDEVRGEIRSVLGNYYSANVNEVFQMINCGNAQKTAEARVERKAREEKEK